MNRLLSVYFGHLEETDEEQHLRNDQEKVVQTVVLRHLGGDRLHATKGRFVKHREKWLLLRIETHKVPMDYPLVNIQKTMENHHFQWVNPLFLWSFSIAILTITRGYQDPHCNGGITPQDW